MNHKIIPIILSIFFASCNDSASSSSDEEIESTARLCFVGDSITHMWDIEKYFGTYSLTKRAKSGAKIDDALKWDYEACHDIPTVVLIGTNHLHFKDSVDSEFTRYFDEQYVNLLEKIGASKYYIISILPRSYRNESPKYEIVKKVNKSIQDTLSNSSFDYIYVDVYSKFLSNDTINNDLFIDGLHPSEEGFDIIASALSKKL